MMYALEQFRNEVIEAINKATGKKVDECSLSVPPSPDMGDLSTNIAFELAKERKSNPKAIADDLVKKIKPSGLVAGVKSAGPYVNFYLDQKAFSELVLKESVKDGFGSGKTKKERVIIEHTSINPSGPIHIGRFRNPVIGDALVRLWRFQGYNVNVHNYINDIGRQIAIIYKGNERKIPQDPAIIEKYAEHAKLPDYQTFFTYVSAFKKFEEDEAFKKEVTDLIKRCESGDRASLKKLNDVARQCLSGQQESLARCGIKHDTLVFESQFISDGSVESVVKSLKSMPEAKRLANGAYAMDLSKHGVAKEEGTVFLRADGTTVYTTRDLAYHMMKFKGSDRSIVVLGEDHKVQAKELDILLNMLGEKTDKHEAVFISFVNFEGKKMSTRKGEAVFINEVLDEGVEKALEAIKEKNPTLAEKERVAEQVGIGAIKYYIIKVEQQKPITFVWDTALDFNGDTGPYLQYAHVRCAGILDKLEKTGKADAAKLVKPEELILVKRISEFPEIARESAMKLTPHRLAQYLLDLVHAYSSFYDNCPVMKETDAGLKAARAELVKATKNVLKTGLGLLGIEAPEKM